MKGRGSGWERFAVADWGGARDVFTAALENDPDDPDALDGLGQSLWWLGQREEAINCRRDAYAAFQRRGDARGAGRLATYLAGEERIDGRHAAAAGWLARARRLLTGNGMIPELGWVAIEEAKSAQDAGTAEAHARVGLAIAHELKDPDVECMALAQLGRAVVRQGRIEEGVSLLDEAMTIALGGETSDPLACGDACCTTLVVCDGLADLNRSAEWCEAVVEFTERRHFTPLQSWCRGIYGGVLVRAGDWERAEAVLGDALSGHADRRRGGGHVLPLAILADLRLRQGRLEEAAALLEGLESTPSALVPLVRLQLRSGNVELSRALLDRGVDEVDEGVGQLLELEVALAEGRLDAAAEGSRRLVVVAEELNRDDLRAEAAFAAGRVAAAKHDVDAAMRQLEDAAERFGALGTPYEGARARLALATVQAHCGSPLALSTARAACDRFEDLGAALDADEAAALLRELGASGRSATRGGRGELTAREREVLRLVVAGLSNGEIATRLVISPKTAEHHVGRVLGKLGVRSRAEAAAHAVREGL